MRTPNARDVCIRPPDSSHRMRNGSISSTRVPSGIIQIELPPAVDADVRRRQRRARGFGGPSCRLVPCRSGCPARAAPHGAACRADDDPVADEINMSLEVFGAVGHTHVHPLRDPFRTAAAPDFRESQHVLVERVRSLLVSYRQAGVEDAFGKRAHGSRTGWPGGHSVCTNSIGVPVRVDDANRAVFTTLWRLLNLEAARGQIRRPAPSRPASRTRDATDARRRLPEPRLEHDALPRPDEERRSPFRAGRPGAQPQRLAVESPRRGEIAHAKCDVTDPEDSRPLRRGCAGPAAATNNASAANAAR